MALACGNEMCRMRSSTLCSRCCVKDSVVALTVELEEVSVVDVFSSDVDNGPIDEMCELQGKSI